MQDTPAIVADDKEAVEDAEADRGHGEEVYGRNHFPVIPKKSAPALGWLGIPRNSLHPAGDASLGYLEAQHEQFRRECEARPRSGSPPSYGRSAPELPATVCSYRPVFSPSRSNSSTVENQRDASQRPSPD